MVPRQLFSEPSFFYFQFKFNTFLKLTKTAISKTIIPSFLLDLPPSHFLLELPPSHNPSFLDVLANIDGEMRFLDVLADIDGEVRFVLEAAYWQLSDPGPFEVWPSGKFGEHGAPLGGGPLGLGSPLKALCYSFAKYLCSSQTVSEVSNFDNTTSELQLRLEVEDAIQTSFDGPCDPLRSKLVSQGK